MEKIQEGNWNIALKHFLRAGLFVPIVATLLIMGPVVYFFSNHNIENVKNILNSPITLVVQLAAIFIGCIYSAKYLGRTYVIKDAKKIVLISALILAVLKLINLISKSFDSSLFIGSIGSVVIFYVTSLVYLKNNDGKSESYIQNN